MCSGVARERERDRKKQTHIKNGYSESESERPGRGGGGGRGGCVSETNESASCKPHGSRRIHLHVLLSRGPPGVGFQLPTKKVVDIPWSYCWLVGNGGIRYHV